MRARLRGRERRTGFDRRFEPLGRRVVFAIRKADDPQVVIRLPRHLRPRETPARARSRSPFAAWTKARLLCAAARSGCILTAASHVLALRRAVRREAPDSTDCSTPMPPPEPDAAAAVRTPRARPDRSSALEDRAERVLRACGARVEVDRPIGRTERSRRHSPITPDPREHFVGLRATRLDLDRFGSTGRTRRPECRDAGTRCATPI